MLLRARKRGSRAASACLRNRACRGRSSRGIRPLRTGNPDGGCGNRRRSVPQLRRQRRGRTAPTARRTRTLPRLADSTTPRRRDGLWKRYVPSSSAIDIRLARDLHARHRRLATSVPPRPVPRAAMLMFAPIRLAAPAARVSFTAGMSSDASPENMPERHLPGVAASNEGLGRSWPNWIHGQVTLTGIPAKHPRHSVGRDVVRENDSCSPLRRITSATPRPRAAAISSSLSMPCYQSAEADQFHCFAVSGEA